MPDSELIRRIQTRAFFLWRERTGKQWWDSTSNWLEAQQIEKGLASPIGFEQSQDHRVTEVYRFRSMDALLGPRAEHEDQYIYLSSPPELNDPMEGYKDVFWRGDPVLWENLLRHYLLALLCSTAQCQLMDDASFEEPRIAATLCEDDLPTAAFRNIYQDCCDRFFASGAMSSVPGRLSALACPLHTHGLKLILSLLHLGAFGCVAASMQRAGLVPAGWGEQPTSAATDELVELIDALGRSSREIEQGELEKLAFAFNQVQEQEAVRCTFGFGSEASTIDTKKKVHLLFSFPHAYVRAISDTLIHPEWYVACFSEHCDDASMWANYADQHRGAALIYRVEHDAAGRPYLPLSVVTGCTSSRADPTPRFLKGPARALLHPVSYTNKAPEIDFFQCLAMLPRQQIVQRWHSSTAGVRSSLPIEMLDDEAGWRKRLWNSFNTMATTKLRDWSHEREHRIVLPDGLGMLKEDRKAEYNLSHLSGVVFGLRTSMTDRLAMIKVLQRKCEAAGRSDFKFYQMSYHPTEGRLIRL